MNTELETLRDEAQAAISKAGTPEELQAVAAKYIGKSGTITDLTKKIKDLPIPERKTFGQDVNQVKTALEGVVEERRISLSIIAADKAAQFDVTVPGKMPQGRGTLHPVTQMMHELNDAFLSLGFEIFDGPEISSEAYCFDSLNFPPDHPARESMDTYWVAGDENARGAARLNLRPHLTGLSVRYMQTHTPPFRFVYPGRVYRNESTDAGHERAFYQYEALIVDKEVPFSSGRLLVNTILERVFGRKVRTRMRAGFFLFVEPGFEIDMECLVCGGKGCGICKRVGWLEMMPGGPPHPNVFRQGGIDPEKWQGFYINIGLDRLVMMRQGIDDIRLLHSTDLRFFRQFA